MARTPTAITTAGGLLPRDLLSRLASDPGSLSGTRPEDYHLALGRRLQDGINRSWADLLGQWATFRGQLESMPESDTAATITRDGWLYPLLGELGFGRLPAARGGLVVDGDTFPISHVWGPVPIHLLGANVDLDRSTRGVAGAARSSPHALVQDFLNRSDDHLWGLVSNGRTLRLLRDHTSLSRPAYVEFDLESIFESQSFADFAVLWLLCHQSRFEVPPEGRPEACRLEHWAVEARQGGVRALEDLRRGFESAIKTLGAGFLSHPANTRLVSRFRERELDAITYHHQLLRLVYRLVFLLVVEDRQLLLTDPTSSAAERYRSHYSLDRLRDAAERSIASRHSDLWESLKPVVAALGHRGSPTLGLPGLGSFLWSADSCPDLDGACLGNVDLLGAVRALAFTEQDHSRQRVDFAHLGPEELGGVYESLLELVPRVEVEAGAFLLETAAGHERKTTGSYYTPSSLVSELLDSALEPVVDQVLADAPSDGREAALLSVSVLDPACGSGHFLIAAGERLARRLASIRSGEAAPSPVAIGHALRDVISHCLYGIDANPMAIELAKVNLWLAAMEPGQPLSFLDHHLACGNALLGATPEMVSAPIPDDAYKALTGDDKATATEWRRINAGEAKKAGAGVSQLALGTPLAAAVSELAERAAALEAMPDDAPEAVEAKAAAYASYAQSAQMTTARLSADAWCAAFFLPKARDGVRVTTSTVSVLARGAAPNPSVIQAVEDSRRGHGFLHWHLAFPEVMAQRGGFAVVIGNPPWEKVKLSEKEFFASRHPELGAAAGARRKTLIAALEQEDPLLWSEFRLALRSAEAESTFLRTSGRFPLCGRGDVNTYAVFAEVMRAGLGPSGRMGVVVPTGIATTDTTKDFFSDCVQLRRLVSLFSFENSLGLFSDVHRDFKFCLLTLTGPPGVSDEATFSFFAHRTSDLDDPERRFSLTTEDLELLNPNTRTAPIFRTRTDAELTKRIYRNVPVLLRDGDRDGNPWGVQYQRMFDMTNDSVLFRSAAELEGLGAERDGNVWRKASDAWLPLYEAKMIHQYNHRWGDYSMQLVGSTNVQLPDISDSRLADPNYVVRPRYWVAEPEVLDRLVAKVSWLLGFRDITNPTNERTFIATPVPLSGVGNKLPLLNPTGALTSPAGLIAVLSSFVFDYAARQKIAWTTMNFFIAKQLPVLPPEALERSSPWAPSTTVAVWMAPKVLELTYTAVDMAGFANDLGYDGPPFPWNPERRRQLRAELDAACFHLYGLDRDEVDYVMDTFPIVRRKDEAAHGEYLTKRLILEQYDTMASLSSSSAGGA